jgi:hypothetical protein
MGAVVICRKVLKSGSKAGSGEDSGGITASDLLSDEILSAVVAVPSLVSGVIAISSLSAEQEATVRSVKGSIVIPVRSEKMRLNALHLLFATLPCGTLGATCLSLGGILCHSGKWIPQISFGSSML